MIWRSSALLVQLISIGSLLRSTQGLYFYLEAGAERCFFEEVPQQTIVTGHYKGEEWSEDRQEYYVDPKIAIQIAVVEQSTGEKIVDTRGLAQGRFTFTSHHPGEHSICLRTNSTNHWFKSAKNARIHLDITIGQSKIDVESEKDHVQDLASRIKDLNIRLKEIRAIQQFQREREIQFRELSEITNSRTIWWSLVQIGVLFYMCIWQLRHLRGFFESKKLR